MPTDGSTQERKRTDIVQPRPHVTHWGSCGCIETQYAQAVRDLGLMAETLREARSELRNYERHETGSPNTAALGVIESITETLRAAGFDK